MVSMCLRVHIVMLVMGGNVCYGENVLYTYCH